MGVQRVHWAYVVSEHQSAHRPGGIGGTEHPMATPHHLRPTDISRTGTEPARYCHGGAVDDILDDASSVRPMYQPIVELASGVVVGYEALARWPAYPGVDPTAVFTAAAERGVAAELDHACRVAAVAGAQASGLSDTAALFVNMEPPTGTVDRDSRVIDAIDRMDGPVVVELTERFLLADPAALLSVVRGLRAAGCLIALDDVGAHPDSVTLLDFIAPDVVKLDRTLIQHDPSLDGARTIAAVSAYIESTGAVLLAEGIETEDHLARALALGATAGQGWMYGIPAALPASASAATEHRFWTPNHPTTPPGRSPSLPRPPSSYLDRDIAALPSDLFVDVPPAIGRKALLVVMTTQIEDHARRCSEPLTVLTAFEHACWFTASAAARYSALAEINPFVAVLGVDMATHPAPGVRGSKRTRRSPRSGPSQWSAPTTSPR